MEGIGCQVTTGIGAGEYVSGCIELEAGESTERTLLNEHSATGMLSFAPLVGMFLPASQNGKLERVLISFWTEASIAMSRWLHVSKLVRDRIPEYVSI